MQAESLEQKHARLHSHDKRWCQHVPTMSDLTARRGTSNLIGDDCRMSKGFELRVLESPLFPTSLCGVLVFGSVSRRPSASHLPSSHSQLVHTQLAHIHLVLTHLVLTQLAHTQLVITQLAHTQLVHTQLAHIHLVLTHLVLTQLSHHTTCSHNLLTHNLSSHNLSSHNLLTHTHLVLKHTTCPLCVAGVALTALGRLWWRTGFPNDAVDAAALCVAGVALGDIDAHFAWQAWHLVTSTLTLRGRRGTYGAGPALVAHRVPK